MCVHDQVSDRSLFELLMDRMAEGSFAVIGSRVGRQAQIIATFASIRLHKMKIVKSSGVRNVSFFFTIRLRKTYV